MSSDRQEPGDLWPNPPNPNRTQSPDEFPPQEAANGDFSSEQQQAYAYLPNDEDLSDTPFLAAQDDFADEGDQDAYDDVPPLVTPAPPLTTNSFLQQLWHYVTLIVFPLLFFGIACLLILLPIATGHAVLPTISFWFIVGILVLIALGQGIAVHLTRSYHYMWALATGGGGILFVLIWVFAMIGPLVGTLLLLALLVGGVFLARRCIHPVPEGMVDIISVSKKYQRTLYPGFNLLWPWEEMMSQVTTEEINWQCPPQKIQLSPEEDVILRAVVSYQVVPEDAHLAVTQVKDWQESLRELFVTTLQTVSVHFQPTDFLPWSQDLQAYQAKFAQRIQQGAHLPDDGLDDFTGGAIRRDRINTLLYQQMRDRVAMWGIQIHWVRIRDIELAPHTMAAIAAPPALSDQAVDEELIAATNSMPAGTRTFTSGQEPIMPIDQGTTEAFQMTNSPASTPPPPLQKLPSETTMRKAYMEIQSGKITDPQTIRRMATIFDAVANNPQASQKISFDVVRAASNLHMQAQHYEDMYHLGEIYSDTTKPDI
jgi:regulator of protease activity HflC (stomatin/prohibitin superfamily)